ncbi:aldo/keto reductase [Bacillus sp. 2205SS5-2]|uniref:aldo/keto reductase n=1 Tax=Bacillus sp. 2205SS5-2 TaxID=3109031 RepID=UPI0030045BA9
MITETKVPLRRLGESDLEISALGLGTWQFSKGNNMVGRYWSDVNETDIEKIVEVSYSGGINWFDTAEVYGKGKSEEALALALNKLKDGGEKAFIATKWWPLFRKADSIIKTIDERIVTLKDKKIDLYQIHQPYSFSSVKAEMDALAELLKQGKIRYAGVSNFNEAKMREAHAVLKEHGFPLVSNQMKYSLLDRRIEKNGVLQAAKELGMTIIAYSPLEQGLLSGKFHKNPELLQNIKGMRKHFSAIKPQNLERTRPLIDLLDKLAIDYGVSTTQIALNWLIHFHGDTIVAIPGASKIHHAEQNIGTLSFKLSQKHLQEIDRVSNKVALK